MNKEQRKRIRTLEKEYRDKGNIEMAGILAEYFRLKVNYIPQLLRKFDDYRGLYHFPHLSRVKKVEELLQIFCDDFGINDKDEKIKKFLKE